MTYGCNQSISNGDLGIIVGVKMFDFWIKEQIFEWYTKSWLLNLNGSLDIHYQNQKNCWFQVEAVHIMWGRMNSRQPN